MSSTATAPAPAAPPASASGPLPRFRFVALGVVWSAYLVVFLSRLCVGPLSPFLKQAFDLNNAQIGGLTSATAVTYAPTLVLAGWLVDRIGVRRALVIGSAITGVFVGAVALAPSYGVMLLLLALSGLGCGFIYPSAVKAVMVWFPPQERATAIGVNQAAVNVSGILGAAIMPALALSVGWRAGFVVAAAMAFAVCGLAAAVYRDPPGGIPSWAAGSAGSASTPPAAGEIEQGLPWVTGDEQADRAAVRPGFLAVVRSRDILLLGLAAMFLCMVEFAALAHLVLFLHLDWAYSVVAAAGLLALCQAAGAFGKPLSGLVSDRLLGRRRKAPLLALAGLAGLACAILALLGQGHTWLLWVALLMLGVGAVGWGGLFSTLAGETAGAAVAGAAAGVTAAIDNIGIFIGPPLFGLIVDRTGSYAPAWWAMVGAAVLAACLLALVREPRRA
ncbi:MAG: MFS transporter [Actinobacteria bacterium]|nr:MFS transporter [Actinomycetota bacterium]